MDCDYITLRVDVLINFCLMSNNEAGSFVLMHNIMRIFCRVDLLYMMLFNKMLAFWISINEKISKNGIA